MIFHKISENISSFCLAAALLLSTLRRLLSILLPIGRLLVGDFNMTKDVAEAATQDAQQPARL